MNHLSNLLRRGIQKIRHKGQWQFTVIAPLEICTHGAWLTSTNVILALVTRGNKLSFDFENRPSFHPHYSLMNLLYRGFDSPVISPLQVQVDSEQTDFYPLLTPSFDVNRIFGEIETTFLEIASLLGLETSNRLWDEGSVTQQPVAGATCPVVMVDRDTGLAAFFAYPKRSGRTSDLLGKAQRATARLLAGGFIIGEAIIDFRLTGLSRAILRAISGLVYKRIFASYAHEDKSVVESWASIIHTLNHGELRWDTKILHSGDDWKESVFKEIRSSNVFQLFWSESASASENVECEWRYALNLKRKGFIQPVYWNDPLPPIPAEFNSIHFSKIPIRP